MHKRQTKHALNILGKFDTKALFWWHDRIQKIQHFPNYTFYAICKWYEMPYWQKKYDTSNKLEISSSRPRHLYHYIHTAYYCRKGVALLGLHFFFLLKAQRSVLPITTKLQITYKGSPFTPISCFETTYLKISLYVTV